MAMKGHSRFPKISKTEASPSDDLVLNLEQSLARVGAYLYAET